MRKPSELLVWFSLFSHYGLFGQLASASPQNAGVTRPVIAERIVEEPQDSSISDDEGVVTITVLSGVATIPQPAATPFQVLQEIPPPVRTATRAPVAPKAPLQTLPTTSNPGTGVQPLGHNRYVRDVCTSINFQLTANNWRDSGVSDWLKEYSKAWRTHHIHQLYGLLGTIAYVNLGRSDFRCELGTLHSCTVTCQEVVSMVPDEELARKIYFAFTAARHYLQHMERLDRAIQNAGQTVSHWIPQIGFSFFWWRHGDHENFLNMIRGLARSAFLIAAHNSGAWGLPMFDLLLAGESIVSQALRIKGAHDRAVDAYGQWSGYQYATKMFNEQLKSTQMREATEAISQNFFHPNYIVSRPRKFTDWEGNHHMAQQANVAQMSLYLGEMIKRVRFDHHESVKRVLQSDLSEDDGSTLFTLVMSHGDFLSPFGAAAEKRTHTLEEKMTNAIKYQILNLAIRSQTTWIHCTKAFSDAEGHPVKTCHLDKSGPQNLKACVGERVCYLYKWDTKGETTDHLAEIMGTENFHKPPFGLKVADIIQSSVLTHFDHVDTASLNRLWTGKGLESIFDPGAPGSFNIPVCIRDTENWNSPVKPYRYFLDDWNPWSSKKTLPCHCGNEWGGSTAHVWEESGLAALPRFNQYRTETCPRQIDNKLQSKLEKYVARCQLGIYWKNIFMKYVVDRDQFCDYVIDVVTRNGHAGIQQLDPNVRTALECKLSLYDGTRVTKKVCKTFFEENEKNLEARLRSGLGTTMDDVAEKIRKDKEKLDAQVDLATLPAEKDDDAQ